MFGTYDDWKLMIPEYSEDGCPCVVCGRASEVGICSEECEDRVLVELDRAELELAQLERE